MSTIVDDTISERGRVYGKPCHSHENIGLAWTGLIQQSYGIKLPHPLPDWLVELMMVSFKVQRSAKVYHADNYIDLAAYAKFAEEDQKKSHHKQEPTGTCDCYFCGIKRPDLCVHEPNCQTWQKAIAAHERQEKATKACAAHVLPEGLGANACDCDLCVGGIGCTIDGEEQG